MMDNASSTLIRSTVESPFRRKVTLQITVFGRLAETNLGVMPIEPAELPHHSNGIDQGQVPWFAIRVRSNFEHQAFTGLTGKGFEAFFPSYLSRRRWSDRVKE